MGGLGLPELLVILFVVLLLFGAKRLPEMGAGLGKAIRAFKDGIAGGDDKPQLPPGDKKDRS